MREVLEKDGQTAGSAADPHWFKDAINYELHVRAFIDSNADGIGDFSSLIQEIDYPRDLGITFRWLLPWHRFFSHQPDLDDENAAVVEGVLKIMRLDKGVDTLRLDAIPYLVERE
jgi:glycosidase